MSVAFEKIDIKIDKVNRIINSAFKVFSKNDFEKASTSLIVKDAEVSRGLLYHYFKNKQELFEYLLYFAFHVISDSMEAEIDWENDDIFVRLSDSMKVKLEVTMKYPFVFDFFERCSERIPSETIKKYRKAYHPNTQKMFYSRNIDFTKFKNDVDIDMMIVIARFTIKGVLNKHFKQINLEKEVLDIDMVMKDIDKHLDFLKSQFYI